MRTLERAVVRIYDALTVMAVAVVFLLCVLIVINIILRTVSSAPLPWITETVQYSMLFAVSAALARMTYDGRHVTVNILSEVLGKRGWHVGRSFLAYLREVISAGIMGFFVYQVGKTIPAVRDAGGFTSVLHLPEYWIYLVLVVGAALMVVAFIMRLIVNIARPIHRQEVREPDQISY